MTEYELNWDKNVVLAYSKEQVYDTIIEGVYGCRLVNVPKEIHEKAMQALAFCEDEDGYRYSNGDFEIYQVRRQM